MKIGAKSTLIIFPLWLIFVFIFSHHLVEPTGIVEAWFSFKGLILYKDFVIYHLPLGRWILIPVLMLSNLPYLDPRSLDRGMKS